VVAALAVSHWVEHQIGWSIKRFFRAGRRYRTVKIKAGDPEVRLVPEAEN
jgi:hypothetical protein